MEKRYFTRNQIEIFHYPGKHLHSFCLSLYLKAGSMYESREQNGISHFLEHVVIRNINYLMKDGLYPHLDKLGLMFNACTYKEFMQFEITGAATHFREAVDVFVKIFEPMCLPAAEIDIERKRIQAEIREDDERDSLAYFTGSIVWKDTSLARLITGTSSSISRMGKGTLCQAHKELFSPDNLFFYVTGCVEQEDILYLQQAVEKYPLKKTGLDRDNKAPVPEQFGNRGGQVCIKKSTDTMVRFSFDLTESRYSQAVYMLLYDILFDCENSKIHQELSEKSGCIYSFDPGMEQYSNIGNLYFQYEVQPGRLLESIEMVIQLFCRLKKGIADELDYVKPVYIDNGELILDHAGNLNWSQAYEGHILKKSSTGMEERKQEFASVTSENITSLAREIFCCRNMVVTVKGKKSKKLEQQIKELIIKLDQE